MEMVVCRTPSGAKGLLNAGDLKLSPPSPAGVQVDHSLCRETGPPLSWESLDAHF